MTTPFNLTVGTPALPPQVVTPMGLQPGLVAEQFRNVRTRRPVHTVISPVIIPPQRQRVSVPPPEVQVAPPILVGTLSFDTNGVMLTDPASIWTLAQQNPDWSQFQQQIQSLEGTTASQGGRVHLFSDLGRYSEGLLYIYAQRDVDGVITSLHLYPGPLV
jgi:hypothetical protein